MGSPLLAAPAEVAGAGCVAAATHKLRAGSCGRGGRGSAKWMIFPRDVSTFRVPIRGPFAPSKSCAGACVCGSRTHVACSARSDISARFHFGPVGAARLRQRQRRDARETAARPQPDGKSAQVDRCEPASRPDWPLTRLAHLSQMLKMSNQARRPACTPPAARRPQLASQINLAQDGVRARCSPRAADSGG
jgi:hypothetical protein